MPLPPGLILNPLTGEISGVPTQAGTFDVDLTVRDAIGTSRRVTDTITINAYTPSQWTGSLGWMMATRQTTSTLGRTGGTAPVTHSVYSGALPAGLSLNESTGAITGTPTTPGAFSFVLRATDAIDQSVDLVVTGTVAQNLTLTKAASAFLATIGRNTSIAAPTTAGGTPSYAYSLAAGTLPAGLSLNTSTGAITGTPTAEATASGLQLNVVDSRGFTASTSAFSITAKAAPAMTGALNRGTATRAYSQSYTTTGGHAPLVYSATGLPPGLSINTSTGAITGTPTTPGGYTPVVTVTDAAGVSASRSNSVSIGSDLVLSGALPEGTRSVPYTFQPVASGGWGPYSYAISSGSLPGGLTLNALTGKISGTPSTQQEVSAVLTVTDADGNTDDLALDFVIMGDLRITGSVDGRGTVGVAYTGDTLDATGGTGVRTWTVVTGALPTGLSINQSTGDISGTPTAVGTSTFRIRSIDTGNSYDFYDGQIVVASMPALAGDMPDITKDEAYSAQLSRSGGHAPYTWTISAGALPTGLTINPSTGVVSGTPTVAGAYSFTVRVEDDKGNAATRSDQIGVYVLPTISGTVTAAAENTVAYSSAALSASGGKPPLSWDLAGGSLPAGLTLNGSTGQISGTPNGAAGTYSFTVKVTDALGKIGTSNQSITLRAAMAIASGWKQESVQGVGYASSVVASGGWAPYSYAKTGGTMPPGLSLNASTGAITGTPSASGNYTFTVTATDALGKTSSYTSTTYVQPPVAISGTPDGATRGVAYGFTPSVSGGWGPFSYAIVSGALPAGLALNGSTGQITGTPTASAVTSSFTIRRTDNGPAGASSANLSTSITVVAYPTIGGTFPRGMVGKAYSGQAVGSGGWTPYAFYVVDGGFPPGVAMNTAGTAYGTPNTTGTYYVRIRLYDQKGNTADLVPAIPIASALGIGGAFANGQVNQAYSSSVSPSGGWSPHTFSHVAGTLPTGLGLTAGGTLQGTPSAAGTFSFTVRITDADGSIADRAFSVQITNPVVMSITASPNPASDTAFANGTGATAQAASSVTVSNNVGAVTYTWTLISSQSDGPKSPTFTQTNGGRTLVGSLTTSFDTSTTTVWRCTARDSTTGATASVDVTYWLDVYTNR